MRKGTRILVSLAAVGALLSIAGEAFGEGTSGGKTYTVEMGNMVYAKVPTTAKVGDTIVWINTDTVQHSATAKDGSFDVRLQPGQKGRTVLKKAGKLAFYCIYHSLMRGTLPVATS
jgi:plastocyanin|uniref:cupredoxin domain-containing protein n=1 Tax=Altererythrobacter segetis TaxID=1104773 RepID=UPI001409A0BB|nr:cupredoxin domain-containing protein [Altererythrobacter segetis]